MLKSLNFPFSDLQDTLEVYSVFASFFRAPIITQLWKHKHQEIEGYSANFSTTQSLLWRFRKIMNLN